MLLSTYMIGELLFQRNSSYFHVRNKGTYNIYGSTVALRDLQSDGGCSDSGTEGGSTRPQTLSLFNAHVSSGTGKVIPY